MWPQYVRRPTLLEGGTTLHPCLQQGLRMAKALKQRHGLPGAQAVRAALRPTSPVVWDTTHTDRVGPPFGQTCFPQQILASGQVSAARKWVQWAEEENGVGGDDWFRRGDARSAGNGPSISEGVLAIASHWVLPETGRCLAATLCATDVGSCSSGGRGPPSASHEGTVCSIDHRQQMCPNSSIKTTVS